MFNFEESLLKYDFKVWQKLRTAWNSDNAEGTTILSRDASHVMIRHNQLAYYKDLLNFKTDISGEVTFENH